MKIGRWGKRGRKIFVLISILLMILSNISLTIPANHVQAIESDSEDSAVPNATDPTIQPEGNPSITDPLPNQEQTESEMESSTQTIEAAPENIHKDSQVMETEAAVTDPKTVTAEPSTEVNSPTETELEEEGLNSLAVQVPEGTYSDIPVLITELSPNSAGAGTDYYEFFELYNNTDKPIALNNYSFVYRYTDTGKDVVFQIPTVSLEPQETKVFWFNNGQNSLVDFNQNYNLDLTAEKVVEFSDTNFPGFANGGFRALVLKDASGIDVVSASYLATDNDNTGAGIEYKFPSQGTEMEKYRTKTAPTPGTIESIQVPTNPIKIDEQPVDKEAPVITHTPVSTGEAFTSVTIRATVTDNSANPFATLYYKKEGADNFTSVSMIASQQDAGLYTAEIPTAAVESDLVYYIVASDGVNLTKTEEYTIKIQQPDLDFNKVPPFLVTEIVPDSTNVGTADGYEFIEVYNNSDKPINFKDYKIQYRYGEDPATDVVWPSVPDQVVIPAQGTLVFWIINAQNGAKTVADFNRNYGTSLVENKDIVKIYSDGMANASMRGLVVATNTRNEIAVAYYFDEANVDDTNPNKGILYKYPVDGSRKMVKVSPGLLDATPGSVEAYQIPNRPVHMEEDTIAPTIENRTGLAEIDQKENIHIVADVQDDNEVKSVRLFYRNNTQSDYSQALLAENYDDRMYHHTIHAPEIIGKEYVEYYFVVSDGTNEVKSETYKMKITSDLDNSSLRLNVKDGEYVKGEKILKGTSQADAPDQVKLLIDGKEVTEITYKSLEHRAYFAFEVSGVNTFFQNGVTMGDEVLKIFDDFINDWDTITVPIPADKLQVGENTITVRAGNKASPFQLEESEENRDDFNIRNARLVLIDGTILMDPAHSDPAKVYDMGDDGTYRPFEDFKFTITEDLTHSKTFNWDTTSASDGQHVVTAQDSDEEINRTVVVDNTAPVIRTNIIEGKEYKGKFTIEAEANDELAGLESLRVMLDDQPIEAPFETSSSQLTPGRHKLVIMAVDKVGNHAEESVDFPVVNEMPNKPELISPADDSSTPVDGNPTLKVKVTDPTNDDLNVTYYQGFQYDANNEGNVKAFKNATDTEPPQTMVPEGEQALTAEELSFVSQKDGKYLTSNSGTQFPYHRFDVTVDPSVDENDKVELVWNGKSLQGRKVSMYAWNHLEGKWALISFKIAGAEDFELIGDVTVGGYVKDSKINVLIQDEIPKSPDEYDYTFVWMSDTQYYSESYPYIFERQTSWIAENKDRLKIKYVFHTGDLVDEADKEYQWVNADQYMRILDDNQIPYGVLAGNHDVDHKTSDYTQYYKWFGEDRFKGKSYYGESYKNNRGHYDLISTNGNDFIMVYMGWGVQDEDLQWVNDVLQQYPNRKAILNFHEYLLVSGNRSPIGDQIYQKVVLPNQNVLAVLSGHYHDSETLIDAIDDDGDGTPDRHVYQMLGDYQGGPEGGQGYMKLLHFDQDQNRIIVNTYSPYLDDYNYYEPEMFPGKDEMIIDVDLQVQEKQVATDYFAVNIYTDNIIGEQKRVQSGNTAEADWQNLVENKQYSWYATAEDDYTGKAVSDIWTFTKGKNEQPAAPNPSDDGGKGTTNPGSSPSNGKDSSQDSRENNAKENHFSKGEPTDKIGKQSGNALPKSATNMYNLMLFGLLLVTIGGTMMIVSRHRKRADYLKGLSKY
ncbi:lamin tail domain-containing protein [Bacillus sp. FJAT-29814]|uniref:lamin tail domain-containing protein n=1 Tax=Bacillus sp. FJAT-29814 TaxID=1729688 RepID=UPI0008353AC1|nr:lamin tail domain-containing protein [Bacillus sp. FJAT-29814]